VVNVSNLSAYSNVFTENHLAFSFFCKPHYSEDVSYNSFISSFLRTDHPHTSLFNKQKTHTSACVCNLKSMHKRKVERAREKLSRRSAVAHKLSSNHFLVCSSLSLAIMFCTVVQRERRRKGIKKRILHMCTLVQKKKRLFTHSA
jgi:hypothetical protein